jgi:hypothetical protein
MAGAARVVTPRRPGLVTFAAVITFISALSYGLISLIEFSNSTWFVTTAYGTYSLFSSHYLWWGIFDAAIAILAIVAGVSILRGGVFGFMMGFIGASFSAIRWLFYIPSDPWLALTFIALDGLVIYALASSIDYFSDSMGLD